MATIKIGEEEVTKGFRFCPTDQELIECLAIKVDGKSLSKPGLMDIIIMEKKLYGKDEESPWEIFQTPSPASAITMGNERYFFTSIRKKYQSKKSYFERVVANGTWKSQNKITEVYEEAGTRTGKIIGFKRTLNFIEKEVQGEKWKSYSGNNKEKSLIMHEYTLYSYPKRSDQEDMLTLCRIHIGKRGESNPSPVTHNYSPSPSFKRQAPEPELHGDVEVITPYKRSRTSPPMAPLVVEEVISTPTTINLKPDVVLVPEAASETELCEDDIESWLTITTEDNPSVSTTTPTTFNGLFAADGVFLPQEEDHQPVHDVELENWLSNYSDTENLFSHVDFDSLRSNLTYTSENLFSNVDFDSLWSNHTNTSEVPQPQLNQAQRMTKTIV